MLKKLCKCGAKIDSTEKVCSKCRSNYHKIYDSYRRELADFYASSAWRRIRLLVQSRCGGIDQYHLYKTGRIIPGTLAHHIIELRDDASKALELDNLIWLSDASHHEVHALYDKSAEDKVSTQKVLKKIISGGGC